MKEENPHDAALCALRRSREVLEATLQRHDFPRGAVWHQAVMRQIRQIDELVVRRADRADEILLTDFAYPAHAKELELHGIRTIGDLLRQRKNAVRKLLVSEFLLGAGLVAICPDSRALKAME